MQQPQRKGPKEIAITFLRIAVLAIIAWAIVSGAKMLIG